MDAMVNIYAHASIGGLNVVLREKNKVDEVKNY
jgi:hypothetical protein